MTDKSCRTCVFYAPPTEGSVCGQCEYPIPEWLVVRGGSFINSPDYQGKNCPTHKSKADLKVFALNERPET